MDGRKERREEEGSDRTGVVEGGRRKGRRRGEKGNWENRAGRKAQHHGFRKCAPAAKPSSTFENSSQVTLTRSCSFSLKNKGHCPLHPAMLDLQPRGQRKQEALTAHMTSVSRHTTAPRFLQPLNQSARPWGKQSPT